jgi:hypothetical protein
MPEYTVRLRSLKDMPKQAAFAHSKAKRKVVRAGRRSAKTTTTGGNIAVEAFLAGRRVLYGAPTEDQVQRFWFEVTRALEDPISRGILYQNKTKHIIGFPEIKLKVDNDQNPDEPVPGEEARIRAKTAWNADTLRGDFADLLILDEFQLINEDAWELVGVPMLLDNNGDAIFLYTPPSLHSRSASKANNPRHASELYEQHEHDKDKPDWDGRWECFHFTSHDNPHLSKIALEEITQDMTALAIRQEIDAEDSNEAPGALWHRQRYLVGERWVFGIEDNRVFQMPDLVRVVVGVDPSGSTTGDECGIITKGLGTNNHQYTIADDSIQGSPGTWAHAAIAAYHRAKADVMAAEKNYGGEMVEQVIKDIDSSINIKLVNATRGKAIRAEPISAMTEHGTDHMVGTFRLLEDEMCQWVPGDKKSPNRLDAHVWASTELSGGSVDWSDAQGMGHVSGYQSPWEAGKKDEADEDILDNEYELEEE